ncbi:MAG TPA: hypothetical protein VNL91_02500 [Thermoanaerobaculia bacterium]|nr:hypothetical protein [Thermoanaerobaculia bacterium]
MSALPSMLLDTLPRVRYVAIHDRGKRSLYERSGVANASSSESDEYEEVIVNPTLIKLLTQTGNIDCGGLEYVIIRYGSFNQFILPTADGQLSVRIEPDANGPETVAAIRSLVSRAAT